MRRNQLKGRRTEKTKLIVYSAHLAGKSKGAQGVTCERGRNEERKKERERERVRDRKRQRVSEKEEERVSDDRNSNSTFCPKSRENKKEIQEERNT